MLLLVDSLQKEGQFGIESIRNEVSTAGNLVFVILYHKTRSLFCYLLLIEIGESVFAKEIALYRSVARGMRVSLSLESFSVCGEFEFCRKTQKNGVEIGRF